MNDDIDMQQQFQELFLEEAGSLVEEYERQLLSLEKSENKASVLAAMFRAAHSIKGSGASVGFVSLASFAHINEDCLAYLRVNPAKITPDIIRLLLESIDLLKKWIEELKQNPQNESAPSGIDSMKARLKECLANLEAGFDKSATAKEDTKIQSANKDVGRSQKDDRKTHEATEVLPPSGSKASGEKSKANFSKPTSFVKIDADRLESVMELVGELVVIKSQIMEDEELKTLSAARVKSLLNLLDKNIRDLYDRALSLRLTTVQGLVLKLERCVRDAAYKVNKEVDFEVSGADCELDRVLIEKVGDPLMHLVRNAVDHGIESKEERLTVGKSKAGKLRVEIANRGSGISFEIHDDGRGIDREKIIAKAVEKSIINDPIAAKQMSDSEVYELLFAPGFSTAAQVTDLSGRGVGLDVVKSNVNTLKGSVEIRSKIGAGTTFALKLPLTTAIADGLIVRIADEKYIIPLESVEEVLSISDIGFTSVDTKNDTIEIRGKFIHLVDLASEFKLTNARPELAIILRFGNKKYAVLVDEIVGQSQVVLKNLHDALGMSKGVAGTAILGNGRVALVLDVGAFS